MEKFQRQQDAGCFFHGGGLLAAGCWLLAAGWRKMVCGHRCYATLKAPFFEASGASGGRPLHLCRRLRVEASSDHPEFVDLAGNVLYQEYAIKIRLERRHERG